VFGSGAMVEFPSVPGFLARKSLQSAPKTVILLDCTVQYDCTVRYSLD